MSNIMFRIDDYPCGSSAIVNNHIEKYDKILQMFESRGIKYILGIVPMLLKDEDFDFLRSLQCCVPAMHGFDHDQPLWIEGDDRAIERRDEFINCDAFEIEMDLQCGYEILSECFETDIEYFIPPFNRCPEKILPKLSDLGIKYITTGTNPWHPYGKPSSTYGMKVLTPKPQFYGRISNIHKHVIDPWALAGFDKNKDHIALHLTWEFEDYELGFRFLEPLLDRLNG